MTTTPGAMLVIALIALIGLASSSAADIIMSQSNSARLVIDEEIERSFEAERDVLAVSEPGPEEVVAGLTGVEHLMGTRKPDEIRYDRQFIARQPAPDGGEAWRCLSEALYFEARGERTEGIFAVAEVILNRVDSPIFPDTVCEVVYQGTGRLFECQFTYSCDGLKETIHEGAAYEVVAKVARLMLDGAPRGLTDGATHYHTRAVSPAWARVYPRTATIGHHHFYRKPDRYASN